MRATFRDQKLLHALHGFGILTSRQIQARVFSRTDLRTVLRRLRILERRKLIQRNTGLERGTLAWSLTAVGGQKGGVIGASLRINKNTLEHDVLFNTIRLHLESSGLKGHWKSGHSMSQASDARPEYRSETVIPDGLLVVAKDRATHVIAIELEVHAKSQRRYRRIFELYSGKEIATVWYWVPTLGFGQRLSTLWEKYSYSSQIQFAWSTVDDCLADPSKLRLHTKDKVFFLESIATFSPQTPAHSGAHTLGNAGLSTTNTQNTNI